MHHFSYIFISLSFITVMQSF